MSCLVLTRVPEAHARDAAAPLSDRITVTLSAAESGTVVGIQPDGADGQAQSCQSSCTFAVLPGVYRVSTFAKGERSSRRLKIAEPERLILTPPDPTARRVGSGLAISGMALGGAGSIITLYALGRSLQCGYGDGSDCRRSTPILLGVGVGALATGLALGIPGMVLAVTNSRPKIRIEKYEVAAARGSQALFVGLGAAGALTGLNVSASF